MRTVFQRAHRDGKTTATKADKHHAELRSEQATSRCMIDQIGGWKSVSSIGNNYGKGFSMEQVNAELSAIDQLLN